MKLRNKKTGEIREFIIKKDKIQTASLIGGWEYTSLANLCKDWEDYEEPKEFWYISDFGFIFKYEITERTVKSTIEEMKSIGNYFETKEEAEKAVRKLKAWKLLKDMGFKIEGIRYRNNKSYIEWSISQKVRDDHFTSEGFNDCLHFLFGGEE